MFATIALILLVLLLVLVVVFGGGYFLVYWWMISRPIPKLKGTVTLPGFSDSVEILRDKHAVPHIYAESRADLFRAQGYVHAQERFWQMERQRRTARGTLAELFGSAALDADRFSRIIGFQRAAEVDLVALDDETRQTLEWYAEGVNAFIDANPGKLCAELNLLRGQVDPWQVVDTLAAFKVVAWGLCGSWESELVRLQLHEQLGPIRAADLEPDAPAETPIVLEGLGSKEATRLLHASGLLLNQYEHVKEWLGFAEHGQGSNGWALGPERSLNGRPLLCADPHLALQIPGLWYENHLCVPDFEASGVSIAGMPGVVMGHNEQIAWGQTNAMVDVQDLYLERSKPGESTQFEYEGEWHKATVLDEVIHVRSQAEPHRERVIITRHGPLINGLLRGITGAESLAKIPISLCWTGQEADSTIRAILGINQSTNREQFEAALDDWTTPPQSFVYADGDGHIGYRLAGRMPAREQNLGLVPSPGWDAAYAWQGMIPTAELPGLFDPSSGAVVSANNKMVGDDYPYFLGLDHAPGWRAKRIEALLAKRERHTIRDMEEIQLDTGSTFAEALAPWIGLLYSDDPWEKTALNAIRNWNYRMDTDSEAALVFHYMLQHLLDHVFGDKVGPVRERYYGVSSSPFSTTNGFLSKAEVRLLQILNKHEESTWYMDAKSRRRRTRDELLQEALTAAVKRIRKTVGDSTLKWDWGRSHQIRYVHQLGTARFLRGFFNRGPFPIGGDGSTPMQTRQAPGQPTGLVQIAPSYRQIYEVGAWDRAETITTSGQSGHALSDHYDDQITMYREGVYKRVPWSREAVEEATVYRARLEPER